MAWFDREIANHPLELGSIAKVVKKRIDGNADHVRYAQLITATQVGQCFLDIAKRQIDFGKEVR